MIGLYPKGIKHDTTPEIWVNDKLVVSIRTNRAGLWQMYIHGRGPKGVLSITPHGDPGRVKKDVVIQTQVWATETFLDPSNTERTALKAQAAQRPYHPPRGGAISQAVN